MFEENKTQYEILVTHNTRNIILMIVEKGNLHHII